MLSLRQRVIAALEPLLEDRTPVPQPDLPFETEELPPPRRVCDEAYLALRKLLAGEEDERTGEQNAYEFLAREEEERDVEIRRARTSRTWTNWLGE